MRNKVMSVEFIVCCCTVYWNLAVLFRTHQIVLFKNYCWDVEFLINFIVNFTNNWHTKFTTQFILLELMKRILKLNLNRMFWRVNFPVRKHFYSQDQIKRPWGPALFMSRGRGQYPSITWMREDPPEIEPECNCRLGF